MFVRSLTDPLRLQGPGTESYTVTYGSSRTYARLHQRDAPFLLLGITK